MRLALKALFVCSLGMASLADPTPAAGPAATLNPCGSIFCIQGGCPSDVDTWCASRVWGPCPGENVCNEGFPICTSPPWGAQVTCGEGET